MAEGAEQQNELKCLWCEKLHEEGSYWYLLAKYPNTGEGVVFCSQECILSSTWELLKGRLAAAGEAKKSASRPNLVIARDLPGAGR